MPLTKQFVVMEVYADDEARARRNSARRDMLSPEIWQFYEKSGGYMPPALQEKLIFERIDNDGTVVDLERDTTIAYERIQEKFRRSIEGNITRSPERL